MSPSASASASPSVAPSATPSSRPGAPDIATDRKVVSRNGKVKVSAKGFEPGSDIQLWLTSNPILLGTFPADQDGEIHVTVGIPGTAELGDHHIVATGADPDGEDLELSEAVTVLAPPETATADEAAGLPVVLGLLLFAITAALVVRPGRLAGRRVR